MENEKGEMKLDALQRNILKKHHSNIQLENMIKQINEPLNMYNIKPEVKTTVRRGLFSRITTEPKIDDVAQMSLKINEELYFNYLSILALVPNKH